MQKYFRDNEDDPIGKCYSADTEAQRRVKIIPLTIVTLSQQMKVNAWMRSFFRAKIFKPTRIATNGHEK